MNTEQIRKAVEQVTGHISDPSLVEALDLRLAIIEVNHLTAALTASEARAVEIKTIALQDTIRRLDAHAAETAELRATIEAQRLEIERLGKTQGASTSAAAPSSELSGRELARQKADDLRKRLRG